MALLLHPRYLLYNAGYFFSPSAAVQFMTLSTQRNKKKGGGGWIKGRVLGVQGRGIGVSLENLGAVKRNAVNYLRDCST
ncbi:hypothetical protein E2C01_068060 [Portunus trituberculatus]|uniref:Uncharacterized protein n=1 Tax=Portunus trituberculatus TaxID=210409 RepID=A0A5B7HUS5_PORTR|nr:hypothetical protein [Portunus trituberculatus]